MSSKPRIKTTIQIFLFGIFSELRSELAEEAEKETKSLLILVPANVIFASRRRIGHSQLSAPDVPARLIFIFIQNNRRWH